MANFTPVKPGGLITAAYFNQVLGSFDTRISALEAASTTGGQIVIQQLLPLGNFYVGNQMHVVGQNFGVPANVVVTLGGQQITSFAAGSGNTDLYFDIPPVQGLSQAGTMVSLVVDNSTSPAPASTSFTLFPVQQISPAGNLFATMTTPPSVGTITAGNSYVYIFTVTSQTSLSDNYALTVALDSASQAAGWIAVPVDATSQSPITSIPIPQGQNITTRVGVKVTVPATAAAASVAQMTLTLTSSLKPGISGFGTIPGGITVGSAPAQANAIGLKITNPGATGTLSASGNSVSFTAGTSPVTVIFLASLTDGGPGVSYSVKLTFDDASWVPTIQGPGDFPMGTANSTYQIRYSISLPSGTSSTNMHLTVTEDGKPSVQGIQTWAVSV
jgi:hypothetical protein